MWNIACIFKDDKKHFLVKGLDKRPLLFTEKFYADRQVYEWNLDLQRTFDGFKEYYYVVVEAANPQFFDIM